MLEELFATLHHSKNKHGHHGRELHGGWDHHSHHRRHFGTEMLLGVARAITQRPALLAALVSCVLAVLFFGGWLLFLLLSRAGPLFDIVKQNGLHGVLEALLNAARVLWEGTGK